MYSSRNRGAIISFALAAAIVALASAPALGATRQIPSSGTTTMQATAPGADGLQFPEIPPGMESDEDKDINPAGSFNRSRPGRKLGVLPHKNLDTPVVASSAVAGSNPEVALSFRALNHREQRLADGGNQFSLEPPDQGFCVGNGFLVEAVNSALRVYKATDGSSLTAVQALNPFFGYPHAFDRTTFLQGPFVIDPICHYDPDNNRFIVALTTLGVDPPTGNFTGKNTIDFAVSKTGDPTARTGRPTTIAWTTTERRVRASRTTRT